LNVGAFSGQAESFYPDGQGVAEFAAEFLIKIDQLHGFPDMFDSQLQRPPTLALQKRLFGGERRDALLPHISGSGKKFTGQTTENGLWGLFLSRWQGRGG
jgi:hypothetical protein